MNKIRIKIVDVRGSNLKRSIYSILTAAAVFAVLFGPGLLAQSAAMQWGGFLLLIFMLILISIGISAQEMTIEEAEKKIAELKAADKGGLQ